MQHGGATESGGELSSQAFVPAEVGPQSSFGTHVVESKHFAQQLQSGTDQKVDQRHVRHSPHAEHHTHTLEPLPRTFPSFLGTSVAQPMPGGRKEIQQGWGINRQRHFVALLGPLPQTTKVRKLALHRDHQMAGRSLQQLCSQSLARRSRNHRHM